MKDNGISLTAVVSERQSSEDLRSTKDKNEADKVLQASHLESKARCRKQDCYLYGTCSFLIQTV